MEIKRLFFAFSVEAPWPSETPQGRILDEAARHVTLAFLGNQPFQKLEDALGHFPEPAFLVGPVGKTDKVLFLPPKNSHVVAQHVIWLTSQESILRYQVALTDWIENLGYSVDRRPFLPHVTLARAPFELQGWEEFSQLPLMITGIHLYESLGHMRYQSIWKKPLVKPFEEIEHTADIAFHIRGQSLTELYINGAAALAFKFPPFLTFLRRETFSSLDEVIQGLNRMLSHCDLDVGCPFKAVSYHGKLSQNSIFNWEMIVDV